ncbi:MAG: hypothetical protein ACRECH_05905 [Nitrososphaerales archaeon]
MQNSALFIVSAEVILGKEEEFNTWYNEHHIPLFSGKLPFLKSVRRYFSKKSSPQFLTIYEYESYEDLEKSLASLESKAAREDSTKQVGLLVKHFVFSTYSQIFPK